MLFVLHLGNLRRRWYKIERCKNSGKIYEWKVIEEDCSEICQNTWQYLISDLSKSLRHYRSCGIKVSQALKACFGACRCRFWCSAHWVGQYQSCVQAQSRFTVKDFSLVLFAAGPDDIDFLRLPVVFLLKCTGNHCGSSAAQALFSGRLFKS